MHTKDNIPVTWPSNFWDSFEWRECVMTDAIPQDDVWDTPARQKILELEEMYAKINLSAEATKHYMSIRPPVPPQVQHILDEYKTVDHNYNFLKLNAGHNIVKHYDTYAHFINFNKIAKEQHNKIKRTIIMMTEWSFGQVLQVDDVIESHWRVGDTYTWEGDTWHGLGNFGLDDCVIMQVTWL